MKQPSNRTLGKVGMWCAPFLLIQFISQLTLSNEAVKISLTGLFGLIYMTGWMASLLGFWRLHIGKGYLLLKSILLLQLVLLTLSNIFNLMQTIFPVSDPLNYQALDIFWPVTNLFMLVTTITMAAAGKPRGTWRYVPLLAGTWFPLSCYPYMVLGRTPALLIYSGIYSLVAYWLLGRMVRRCVPSHPVIIRSLSKPQLEER